MRNVISKKLIMLMIAGLFVLLTGASLAQAADEEVRTQCTSAEGWTTTLLEGFPQLLDNCDIDTELCYLWTYNVQSPKSDTKGLNHINFNISTRPYYSTDIATLVAQYDNSATLAEYFGGTGEPTTDYGKGILQYYVAKFTPQSSDGTWSFLSNTNGMGTGTVGLKINNELSLCEIAVPDKANEPDPGEPTVSVISSEQIIHTTDNKKFRILEDDVTQCIIKAQYWDGETWIDMTKSDIETSIKITEEDGTTAPSEYFGVPGQGCPRAIVKRQGNNTWYFISGRYVWIEPYKGN